MRKVIIGLETRQTLFDKVNAIAKRADAGEALPEADYYLNFGSVQQLFGELTPDRMQILQTLLNYGKLNVEDLAQRMRKEVYAVEKDLEALARLDLIAQDAGLVFVPWGAVEMRFNISPNQAKAA